MVDSAILGLGLVGWFGILAFAELISARRAPRAGCSTDARLVTNFGLGVLVLACNSLAPIAKIGSSAWAQSLGSGLAPAIGLTWPLALAAFMLADSLAGYWTHRLMHAMPLLWRIHRVHHADAAVDLSTSLRNHPLELVVTIPVSAAVILMTGAQPSVVVLAQSIVFAAAIWHHADIDLPRWLERVLRHIIVTPAYHRLHHSPDRWLHDGNYGDLITLWDRLFGTAKLSARQQRVGLDGQVVRPDRLLAQICWPLYAARPTRPLKIQSF